MLPQQPYSCIEQTYVHTHWCCETYIDLWTYLTIHSLEITNGILLLLKRWNICTYRQYRGKINKTRINKTRMWLQMTERRIIQFRTSHSSLTVYSNQRAKWVRLNAIKFQYKYKVITPIFSLKLQRHCGKVQRLMVTSSGGQLYIHQRAIVDVHLRY